MSRGQAKKWAARTVLRAATFAELFHRFACLSDRRPSSLLRKDFVSLISGERRSAPLGSWLFGLPSIRT